MQTSGLVWAKSGAVRKLSIFGTSQRGHLTPDSWSDLVRGAIGGEVKFALEQGLTEEMLTDLAVNEVGRAVVEVVQALRPGHQAEAVPLVEKLVEACEVKATGPDFLAVGLGKDLALLKALLAPKGVSVVALETLLASGQEDDNPNANPVGLYLATAGGKKLRQNAKAVLDSRQQEVENQQVLDEWARVEGAVKEEAFTMELLSDVGQQGQRTKDLGKKPARGLAKLTDMQRSQLLDTTRSIRTVVKEKLVEFLGDKMEELVQEMVVVMEEGGYHEVDGARTLVDMSGMLDKYLMKDMLAHPVLGKTGARGLAAWALGLWARGLWAQGVVARLLRAASGLGMCILVASSRAAFRASGGSRLHFEARLLGGGGDRQAGRRRPRSWSSTPLRSSFRTRGSAKASATWCGRCS